MPEPKHPHLMPSAGSVLDGVHHLAVRVYYEDTDFTGRVYHANYLRWLERGRSEALRAAGVDHVTLAQRKEPLAFAVRHADIAFLKPAHIDDALVVTTSYGEMRGARIIARQAVFRGMEELVRARIEVACIGLNGRPRRLPPELQAVIGSAAATTK